MSEVVETEWESVFIFDDDAARSLEYSLYFAAIRKADVNKIHQSGGEEGRELRRRRTNCGVLLCFFTGWLPSIVGFGKGVFPFF